MICAQFLFGRMAFLIKNNEIHWQDLNVSSFTLWFLKKSSGNWLTNINLPLKKVVKTGVCCQVTSPHSRQNIRLLYFVHFFFIFLVTVVPSTCVILCGLKHSMFRFQAGGRKKWPNLYFCVTLCYIIFVLLAYVQLGFYGTQSRDRVKTMSPKWPIFCQI